MRKQLWALAAVFGLGAFATASAGASVGIEPQSNVMHWATVVFCEGYENGQSVQNVCVGGHTGRVVYEMIDTTLSAFPGSITFVSR